MLDWFNLTQQDILSRLLIALAVVAAIFVFVQIIKRLVNRYVEDPERRYRASKLIGRSSGILALILVVGALFNTTGELLAVLTIVGAGFAIALREPLMSCFGWIYIAFRSPFKPGDRIEVNGVLGDVIDIRLLHTVMMEIRGWVDADQSTGRLVHVPNGSVFLHGVYNYTQGFRFIWNELSVTVTFRTDWEAAHDIMLSLAEESAAIVEQQVRKEIKKMAREYFIFYNILTPFVYVRIVENGIRLTLRYLCESRKRRGTEHALTISILAAFREHGDIELAYPMLGITPLDSPQFGPIPAAKTPRPRFDPLR
ncbi:MAG: mechanosensitive ion channel family protein [Rhodothermales bacterium]